MKERRRFLRFDCSLKVCYATPGIASVEGNTLAKNISRGGVRLLVSRMIKRGDRLHLKIFTPDKNEAVDAVGKVRWVNEGLATYSPLVDAGLQFTNIKPTEVDQLLMNVQ